MDRTVEPRRIRRLPSQLANQIAAGEVVERPASVVKELLENSLDAGADRIELEVKAGGIALIRIRDNGCGIHPDDIPLSVSAHATSKVMSAEELERVMTLGFRGEALASIAAISRLEITSRPAGAPAAVKVCCDGGRLSPPAPAAHGTGTTIEVRDLFFNTPARRKFLRTERTELGHIEETLRRLALSRSDVAFRLAHNGREILNLGPASGDSTKRLSVLYGKRFAATSAALDFEAAGLRLHGWIAPPEEARGQPDRQYFYVNGRCIRDRMVAHAIRQAYGDTLQAGRHPAFGLFLEIDPLAVDVNVHPTKHEVRFREARLVHDFMVHSLRRALGDERGDSIRNGAAPAKGSVADSRSFYEAGIGRPEPLGDAVPGGYGTPLGAFGGRYLVAAAEEGLVLVDIHMARRGIAAERLRAESGGVLPTRPLLVPTPIEVTPVEAEAIERWGGELAAWGLEFGRLGESEVILRRIPHLLDDPDPGILARNVVACVAGANVGADTPLGNALIDAIASAESGRAEFPDGGSRLLQSLARWVGEASPPHAICLDATALTQLFGKSAGR